MLRCFQCLQLVDDLNARGPLHGLGSFGSLELKKMIKGSGFVFLVFFMYLCGLGMYYASILI